MGTNKKPITKEQIEARIRSAFKRKIHTIFTGAGFSYVPTNDHEIKIGNRTVEIDALFIYKNIWLLCEDTIGTQNKRDHIRTKNESAKEIKNNIESLVTELLKLFPEKECLLSQYETSRIKLYYLYIPKDEIDIQEDDKKLFSNLIFVQPKTLNYFKWIVSCIKNTARNEVFRFLNIQTEDIGQIVSSSDNTGITAPIIYPDSFTGINNNVRVVSFMMTADDLMNTCYVLRKDNWSDSILLYQRLINKSKIQKIREFLDSEKVTFYNNIIVTLPDDVRFKNPSGDYKKITDIKTFETGYQLILPKKLNSICVIDGQHRIFAHYDSGTESEQEKRIRALRKKLHLLVTGLVFPNEMGKEERIQMESKIFLDINSNAKPVSQNILLQIKRIQNPIADESIAQYVIEKLNSHGIFKGLLQISSLDGGKIKTASIVRFALRYLVTITPSEGKQSLFTYWNGDKKALSVQKQSAIEEYVDYCDGVLRNYFGAVKNNFKEQWNDDNSKLLSVISINGFIIAMTRQLKINGLRDFMFYNQVFSKWHYDFSKNSFEYTSSQYRKFSTEILTNAFHIDTEADNI